MSRSRSYQLFIIFLFFVNAKARSDDCVYNLYVKTGSIPKGGTDSKISVTFYDETRTKVHIKNIKSWGGLMGHHYDYFERANLDIFSGRGDCLDGPICAMNLTSDGSGHHHGWFSKYVHVTATGPHMNCSQRLFSVEQWLSKDSPPYELFAMRNYCGSDGLTNRRVRVVDGRDGIAEAM